MRICLLYKWGEQNSQMTPNDSHTHPVAPYEWVEPVNRMRLYLSDWVTLYFKRERLSRLPDLIT